MIVSMWMTRPVITIPPTMTIAEAAGEMMRRGVRRLPVVDARHQLVGLVTLLDLTRAFPPDVNPMSVLAAEQGPQQPVSSVMAQQVRTIAPDTPLDEAALILVEHRISTLPVVQGSEVIGIITESDIFRAFAAILGGNGPSVRIIFELGRTEDPLRLATELARHRDVAVASVLTLDRDGAPLGVVRVTGPDAEAYVDAMWASRHRVLSVARLDRNAGGCSR